MDFIANSLVHHSVSYSVEIVCTNQTKSFIYSCQEPDDRKHLLLEERLLLVFPGNPFRQTVGIFLVLSTTSAMLEPIKCQ